MTDGHATRRRTRRTPKPLDRTRLNDLALHYVARFATSSGKLESYLRRKLRERGWDGDSEPDIAGLVTRFAEKNYVDDAAYARMKASGLLARGYGARRVEQTLRADGLAEDVRQANSPDEAQAREAVLSYVRRRRFGPFRIVPRGESPDAAHKAREKQLAAIVRAGHSFDHARRAVEAKTETELEEWVAEARD
ncbi:regulatory protein RecX [Qipengyuania vesicularis]|uniref:regulatory protein RecX n=1 Tax=Qipengyuania vesicularis TaxID=2867232 RepID=UPI001C86D26A|nr:RecX family transcriptional regulator [Qipengyuania vesicularis]MBX7527785.1 RecX family transcriptional regulator [Qipengyuania vesicularis]